MSGVTGGAAALLAALALLGTDPAPPAYRQEVERWRKERAENLRSPEGWLAVAGLFWLREGANRLGTAADNHIVLPPGSAPAHAGTLTLQDGRVTFRPAATNAAAPGGEPANARALEADSKDAVDLGRLRLSVIERSGRYGLRVRDPDSPRRRAFAGLSWYPVDPAFRVEARFVPAATPRTIGLANVLGGIVEMPNPGHVEFTLRGRALRLEPVLEEDEPRLFFIFRDTTAGRSTYPAGRYFYADPPRDGRVTLDFNKAYSPPCAFTDFATCPLPPKANRLPVAVEAGEKDPGHH
jgi:uncharacterized protein (DUF1684 family)